MIRLIADARIRNARFKGALATGDRLACFAALPIRADIVAIAPIDAIERCVAITAHAIGEIAIAAALGLNAAIAAAPIFHRIARTPIGAVVVEVAEAFKPFAGHTGRATGDDLPAFAALIFRLGFIASTPRLTPLIEAIALLELAFETGIEEAFSAIFSGYAAITASPCLAIAQGNTLVIFVAIAHFALTDKAFRADSFLHTILAAFPIRLDAFAPRLAHALFIAIAFVV